jgi:hypothetical protein
LRLSPPSKATRAGSSLRVVRREFVAVATFPRAVCDLEQSLVGFYRESEAARGKLRGRRATQQRARNDALRNRFTARRRSEEVLG